MAQLFVGQLPFNKFYPDDLINLFRPYGVVVGHELNIRTGSGFVTFSSTDEADAAIMDLHGKKVVEGRVQPLQVMYSKGSKLISPFGRQHRSTCCAKEATSNGNHKKTPPSSVPVTATNSMASMPPAPPHSSSMGGVPMMALSNTPSSGTGALNATPSSLLSLSSDNASAAVASLNRAAPPYMPVAGGIPPPSQGISPHATPLLVPAQPPSSAHLQPFGFPNTVNPSSSMHPPLPSTVTSASGAAPISSAAPASSLSGAPLYSIVYLMGTPDQLQQHQLQLQLQQQQQQQQQQFEQQQQFDQQMQHIQQIQHQQQQQQLQQQQLRIEQQMQMQQQPPQPMQSHHFQSAAAPPPPPPPQQVPLNQQQQQSLFAFPDQNAILPISQTNANTVWMDTVRAFPQLMM